MKKSTFLIMFLMFFTIQKQLISQAIKSYDTEHTIRKIKTAKTKNYSYIIGSAYDGTLIAMNFNGVTIWETNIGNGIMNHDICVSDITDNGNEEILVASASGTTYCLSSGGEILWQFQPNEFPMISVCVVKDTQGTPYIACGGGDMNFYYLSATGELLKTMPSSSYSTIWFNPKFDDGHILHNVHTINFLRAIPQADGSDVLAVNAVISHGEPSTDLYLFKPLEDTFFKKINTPHENGRIAEMRVRDIDEDGNYELLLGAANANQNPNMSILDVTTGTITTFYAGQEMNLAFGYRVIQPDVIKVNNETYYFILTGNQIGLIPESLDVSKLEVLTGKYSFNSMWKDPSSNKIVLGSSQSGGSCIHIIDLDNASWKQEYAALTPPGNITNILANTQISRNALKSYEKPSWERDPLKVYIMDTPVGASDIISNIKNNYSSPEFLNHVFSKNVEDWDRSVLNNTHFEEGRDQRKIYDLTQQEVLSALIPEYDNEPGITFRGGHGRDVYFYNPETTKKVIDGANGKKTVIIYPELDADVEEFEFAMDNLFYPLAEYSQGKNANIYIRSKHAFWFSTPYTPHWSHFLTGEFSDVFVAAMEETEDMSMDQTIAGRMGMWASGVVDDWGCRAARDNTNFMRSRSYSHQMLPNHFLRYCIYNIACGARYPHNFEVDSDYMSFLYELIAKGALYVPKRSEIVSLSPVHLSMITPDEKFLREANDGSWTVRDDVELTGNDAYVFGRLTGGWSGAQVSDWDFSSYASGVKDRRLNFLPPYKNGMVLITPPQEGKYADKTAPRGSLTDHLHPLYKNITKEYITDGHNYYSSDGNTTYTAKEYYQTIKNDIEERAKKLPLTVSGEVAWVVSQTSPTHLRLTIIDGGYINPSDKTATVTFHTVNPIKMTDILDGTSYSVSNSSSIDVDIKCGLFRFIDIELDSPLGDISAVDEIKSMSAPSGINTTDEVNVTVQYETSASRDIYIGLQNTTKGTMHGGKTTTVSKTNNGTLTVSITPKNNPSVNDTYRWLAYMMPEGETWEEKIGGNTTKPVVISNSFTDEIISVVTPDEVSLGEEASININYSASEDREINVALIKRGPWALLKQKNIPVNAGQDEINVNLTIPDETGEYYCRVRITAKGSNMQIHQINKDFTISENHLKNAEIDAPLTSTAKQLKIYPNPVNEMLHIDLDAKIESDAKLFIINNLGTIVLSRSLVKSHSMLNVSNYKSGLYFVKIINGNTTITRKVYKN
ncbi:T9SS type A sorting domain-containing protein [Saccharicrinis aurantiacus]|uniref:T9SS type A sorting domain-containing protein n=1 Tax=Saccharicrinis aurantiacus TaxID=1849719 RepID=UPI0009F9BE0C|nr:T9SS type A sorting domain-containing protein [Saccharicrinis aurantiacus]